MKINQIYTHQSIHVKNLPTSALHIPTIVQMRLNADSHLTQAKLPTAHQANLLHTSLTAMLMLMPNQILSLKSKK